MSVRVACVYNVALYSSTPRQWRKKPTAPLLIWNKAIRGLLSQHGPLGEVGECMWRESFKYKRLKRGKKRTTSGNKGERHQTQPSEKTPHVLRGNRTGNPTHAEQTRASNSESVWAAACMNKCDCVSQYHPGCGEQGADGGNRTCKLTVLSASLVS